MRLYWMLGGRRRKKRSVPQLLMNVCPLRDFFYEMNEWIYPFILIVIVQLPHRSNVCKVTSVAALWVCEWELSLLILLAIVCQFDCSFFVDFSLSSWWKFVIDRRDECPRPANCMFFARHDRHGNRGGWRRWIKIHDLPPHMWRRNSAQPSLPFFNESIKQSIH